MKCHGGTETQRNLCNLCASVAKNNMNKSLLSYTLYLADNALIIGHRNSEWCGHGPVLEQDIAISNIALDCIGQARNFYQYAAQLTGGDATEDSLAYLRDTTDFKNCLLVEQPNGDWAHTILRQFLFSTWQYYFYAALQKSKDEQLAAIAEKALKEVTYHVRWSSEWVIRLGDGTEESKQRMLKAIDSLWMFTDELFIPADFESAIETADTKNDWLKKVSTVFQEATLEMPVNVRMITGGKEGKHTQHLEEILNEMQMLQRMYPGAEW